LIEDITLPCEEYDNMFLSKTRWFGRWLSFYMIW